MKFLLVVCLIGVSSSMAAAYLLPRNASDIHGIPRPIVRDTTVFVPQRPLPVLRVERSVDDHKMSAVVRQQQEGGVIEQGLKKSVDANPEVVEEDWADGEFIEEKDVPQDAEKIEVSANSEHEEIRSESQLAGRSKRGTVTVIRIRNKRTGKVTYIIIRRR